MSIWQKIKAGLQRLMADRNGADELTLAVLIVSMLLSFIGRLSRLAVLDVIALVADIYVLYRILSKNIVKRAAENQKFTALWAKCVSGVRQFTVRMKNRKNYKYFRCPECHALLRLPRKVGEVNVTCGKCKHTFKQKA